MPKAHIALPSGTQITIEGSSDELSAIVSRINEGTTQRKNEVPDIHKELTPSRTTPPKPTPATLIAELVDGGFFKKPKGLSAIKIALEEHGHFYPVTTLSPTMLRLVRGRVLRRIKEQKRWLYVG